MSHPSRIISAVVDVERLEVYAYATAPEAADYVAIMRRFTATLLADWSAHDLIARGVDVRPEVLDARLRFLAAHGNLIESPREVRVSSIAEYQRQPARYAVSAIGAVVHRQVEEVLAASGGAARSRGSCFKQSPSASNDL